MNAYNIVREFENTIAEWTGAPYAIAVESCSMAILLCCHYRKVRATLIPRRTYPSTANAILLAGGKVHFGYGEWDEYYELEPYRIYDSALCLRRNLYSNHVEISSNFQDSLFCLSFHSKKHLPIGRGGMVLTGNPAAAYWFSRARFDGRDECSLSEQNDISIIGYNAYMTPEQAARGLELFNVFKQKPYVPLYASDQGYPDLSKFTAYQSK